ncbi:alpha/beta hydrolase family protein [Sphingomonas hengshuiensis]|uniref:AB hydrolase-1 domain-containing protein n=1 Tax=Sphingomonas hengshuiensis TaxID=1609977 RepID=A0A7U5BFV8_9SPHN|nr:hypothetical protein [Sphingomonas hengshuiensis]AJP74502.1 hypothetical protein TS85_13215 [Sphingomonas hengshuiensis]
MIARQGNFYAGGREVPLPTGMVVADAMYVEYQIPAKQTHPYPLIFFHGGASTGASFWSTPDGREGWATLFLRMGYAVYVVDRPTLGRSPHYEPVDGPKLMPPSRLPDRGPIAAPPKPKPATRFPGVNRAGDPAYEQNARGRHSTIEVPFGAPRDPVALSTYVDTIDREAGAALLDRIGPAILVTHSRAGTTGWQIADARPGLVKAIVAAEPNGPPFYNTPPLGAPGDPVARPFGLTYAPLRFTPPVEKTEDFGALRSVPSGRADRSDCWLPAGPRRTLVNIAKIPVIVLTGGASYHAAYDHCTAAFLKWAGVPADEVLLDDRGISGNTHGFPTETNNDAIAELIAGWLADRGL